MLAMKEDCSHHAPAAAATAVIAGDLCRALRRAETLMVASVPGMNRAAWTGEQRKAAHRGVLLTKRAPRQAERDVALRQILSLALEEEEVVV